MIFSVDRDVLLNQLLIVQKGLPNKTPLPILYAVKFDVHEDHILLTSSNTDVAIQVLIDDHTLNIKEPGKVAIPGRYLIDIMRKITSQRVEFALIEDKLIVIKADRSEFKLRLMDVEDYPEIDFLDLLCTGFCPLIAASVLSIFSIKATSFVLRPYPTLITTFFNLGTCITFFKPKSALSAGTISLTNFLYNLDSIDID